MPFSREGVTFAARLIKYFTIEFWSSRNGSFSGWIGRSPARGDVADLDAEPVEPAAAPLRQTCSGASRIGHERFLRLT